MEGGSGALHRLSKGGLHAVVSFAKVREATLTNATDVGASFLRQVDVRRDAKSDISAVNSTIFGDLSRYSTSTHGHTESELGTII